MSKKQMPPTRREFMRYAACAAVGTAAITNTIWDLRLINAAAGATFSDYKALVCLFLYGGNDANNLIIPTGVTYPAYASARQNLAIAEAQVVGINPTNGDGRTWGLHPSCSAMASLFNTGKLALVANC